MELNIISIIVCIYLGLCTKATCKRPPKIINGVQASIEEFPFMVQFKRKVHALNAFKVCGASIIHQRYALTAAHCTRGRNSTADITLYVGKSSWNEQGVRHTVRNVIDHSGFAFSKNDISLLEVDQEFQYNRKVQPIAIYPQLNVPDGSKVTMIGWGKTDPHNNAYSGELMKVELEVWPLNDCRDYWDQYHKLKITDEMICTGRRNQNGGSCQGDSGGPLIYQNKLIGISSGGIPDCGAKDKPEGVYTRVAAYEDWINIHAVRRRKRKGSRCMARFSYSNRSPKY